MKYFFVTLFLVFTILLVFMEARHLKRRHISHQHHHHQHHQHHQYRGRRDYDAIKNELEDYLKSNLAWLNQDQIEVLNDLKADGSDMAELQNEIWIFYNILKGTSRRNAAKFFLYDCSKLLAKGLGEEKIIILTNLMKRKVVFSKAELLEFLDTNSQNETTKIDIEMFKSRCIDFFGSETVEFIHGLHDEKSSVSIFDNFLIENPNDTFALRIKAEILFRAYRFEEALELYDSILLIEEDPLSLISIEKKKADALAFLERFDEAILIYEKYLETDENSEISDKLINALIRRADQSYDKATEMIFKKHFEGNLEWLNEKQKRIIRRLKVEGKKAPEIFLKINEFFNQLEDEEAKHDAIHSIEHGCIRILYSVFGILKAEELINLRDNSTQGFQIKYKEFFDNLSEEGQKRIANAYMSSCQKVLSFDSEESIPPTMITFLLNKKPVEFLYDTGADLTSVGKPFWEEIGKPHMHPVRHIFQGVGGIAISPLGRCRVWVEINGIKRREWLYILEEQNYSLFGRNWMKSFNLKYNF